MNCSCLKFTRGGSSGRSKGCAGSNFIWLVNGVLRFRYVTKITKNAPIASDMCQRITYPQSGLRKEYPGPLQQKLTVLLPCLIREEAHFDNRSPRISGIS